MEGQDYRARLLHELAERKSRNTAYSLRAFARDLGVSVTTLSDVLAWETASLEKKCIGNRPTHVV